jgi:hypothetical protein
LVASHTHTHSSTRQCPREQLVLKHKKVLTRL